MNSLCAFALNLAVFLLVGKTSALTMNVAGVVKDWLLIAFSWGVIKDNVTGVNLFGYVVAFLGVGYYNHAKLQALKAKEAEKKVLGTDDESGKLLEEREEDKLSKKKHAKWDMAKPVEPVDLTGQEELFGDDARPHPPRQTASRQKNQIQHYVENLGSNSTNQFGDIMQTKFCLKRKAAQSAYAVSKEKDRNPNAFRRNEISRD
uniref:Probable sugar phosphate/phosphate translocator At2g25520 n=1 Tax=Tanacetum cinerariifolium TaxID=118510 RepID=A0A6L2LR90_TANCI|nr:probable sugar phosphate/phosphate translocator At2g25520 [Tanacetum cinerariifolium]